MQINITLFIQMVQFLTAYWFLHRYIFVPAYKIVYKEDHAIKSLEEEIVVLQSSMNDRELENKKEWSSIQNKLLSSVSQQEKNNKQIVQLDNLDFEAPVCELQDQQVEEGIRFLEKRVIQVNKAKK